MPSGSSGVYVKRSGLWYEVDVGDAWRKRGVGTGGDKQVAQVWRKKSGSGVWELESDMSFPGSFPVTGFGLSTGPGAGDSAVVTWSADTNSSDLQYYYKVEVRWYNNNVAGIWRTDLLAQTTGQATSPGGTAGDVVHCDARYKTVNGVYGTLYTSGNVTLTSGIVRQ